MYLKSEYNIKNLIKIKNGRTETENKLHKIDLEIDRAFIECCKNMSLY